jgi:seryl-tRNA synthetase
MQAAAAEIDRLMHVCGAVEFAPEHDRDKALSEVPNELDPTVPVSNDEADNASNAED